MFATNLGIAAPIAKTATNLIERMLGKPFGIAGDTIADQFQHWQWLNRIRIAERAAKKLEESRVAAKIVPPGFLMPLLEAAGNADTPLVQDMFAELLANANKQEEVQETLIVDTLRRLSPADAAVLSNIRDRAQAKGCNAVRIELVESGQASLPRLEVLGLISRVVVPSSMFGEPGQVLSGADNIIGPVVLEPSGKAVVVTEFGRQFLAAVGRSLTVQDVDLEEEREYPDDWYALEDMAARATKGSLSGRLGPEASRILLASVRDGTGDVNCLSTMGGLVVTTGKTALFESNDVRKIAAWEAAIEELESAGFIRANGLTRESFRITKSGFDYADSALGASD